MDISHSNNPSCSFLLCFFLLLLLVSSCSGNSNVSLRCIENERKQLLDFKGGLIDPFRSLSSWVGLDCCKWQGVRCNNRTGHVTELDLESYSLEGKIKPSLIHLKHLTYLSLAYNSIKSPLPLWFSNLTNLEVLDLRSNNFYGTIPGWLGNLCKLRNLGLDSNRFQGGIVEFLDRFSACQNNSLETLYLGSNKLEGSFPASLGALKNLQELDLNNNFFWGSIPASIGNLSSLRFLELSYNNLNGTIPESFGKLAELSTLDLVSNQMEGVLTEAHLANLTKLDSFMLTTDPNRSLIFNLKHDWVPSFRLASLVLVNCLVGPSFPVWLQVQSNLSYVIISNAGISDTIEEEWFARLFSRCWFINLSNNTIKAKLPPKIFSKRLVIVDLSRNLFEGQIPLWLTNATQLYLQRNSFSGSIPENIGELMPQLQTFFLSRNQISGRLPSSICKMKGLKFLSVGHNRFSGELPNCWNKLSSLKVLDASNNSLSGNIPSSLTSLCQLVILILGNNNLRGGFPYPLYNCRQVPRLYILQLRSNQLEGNIPEQLCRLSDIHDLDLSNNNFMGFIPKCFYNFTALKYGNKSLPYEWLFDLQESTTNELTVLVGTKGAELEYNRTLLEVKNIDLSKNNLTGDFPDGICSLAFLDTLNLSRNHLSGSIPENIGDLRWLESLDLSYNNFSGPIPPSLSSLTSLGHLKLSYNNMSGRIPTGNQLQTLNDSSNYEGNPLLCGVPLQTRCSGDNSPPTPSSRGRSNDKLWLYLSIAMGFIVGFWSVCGTLVLKESWRHAYYRRVDDLKERMLLWIALAADRPRRMIGRGNN